MNVKRSYSMTTRAEAAERTRLAILDAAVGLATTRRLADISLDDIATDAGVSVQTVLRRFGSRAGLLEAATAHAGREVADERQSPVGDVAAAMAAVVAHYERRGDGVILLLGQETTDPQVRRITDNGRRLHRDWVETVFAPYLPAMSGQRRALVDLLVIATDVYTWKLLRRDIGLDRPTTEQRMRQLVSALTIQE